jgi:tRNA (mo5U34)-methyltransferase
MDKATLQQRVRSFPFWYHRIRLPADDGGEVLTPGWAPLDAKRYELPADLSGRRVLDVGAWDGYWTFEALRRGAREAVAIDDFSDNLGALNQRSRRAWETFDLCREALGLPEDRCRRIEMSVYDVSEDRLGRFDVVLFFGTLYHLRHPLLALDRLAAVCDADIFVESAVCDEYSPHRGGIGFGYPGEQMVAEFYPGKEYGNNETNWWCPTVACMCGMVKAAGFPTVRGWKYSHQPKTVVECRGFAHGRKK